MAKRTKKSAVERGAPAFSFITVCKGRLHHLRQTLPSMIAQADSEVIVVDYSCPDGTANFVNSNYPEVRVVRVDGEDGFSNWGARNAGAAVARGDTLVFCDADTVLSPDATRILATAVPAGGFGHFSNAASGATDATRRSMLARNQLKGFHVVPAERFQAVGGYDDQIAGYAAGADTDLEDRLMLAGLKAHPLPQTIVERLLVHSDEERMRFHRRPVALSFIAGLLHRKTKLMLMRARLIIRVRDEMRAQIARAAQVAAQKLAAGQNSASVSVIVREEKHNIPVGQKVRPARLRMIVRVEMTFDRPGRAGKTATTALAARPPRR